MGERDGCTTTALLAGSEGDGCTIVLLAGSEGDSDTNVELNQREDNASAAGWERGGRLYDCTAGWEPEGRLYDCAAGCVSDRDGCMTTALLAGNQRVAAVRRLCYWLGER